MASELPKPLKFFIWIFFGSWHLGFLVLYSRHLGSYPLNLSKSRYHETLFTKISIGFFYCINSA